MAKKSTMFQQIVGDSPKAKVLEYLLEWEDYDLNITDIAKGANISRTTAYEVIEDLQRNKILLPTRTMGQSQLYRLNKEHILVKKLKSLFRAVVAEA